MRTPAVQRKHVADSSKTAPFGLTGCGFDFPCRAQRNICGVSDPAGAGRQGVSIDLTGLLKAYKIWQIRRSGKQQCLEDYHRL